MTEQEILKLQENNGNSAFYLMLIGKFLHAYGHGAFALARATGYRVLRKQRKSGEVLTCGFPMDRLDTVRQRLRDAGGTIEPLGENTFLFRDLDGTPDLKMVCNPQPKAVSPQERQEPAANDSWLAEAVRGFNLSLSTPMEAMLFIGTLQQRLQETDDKERNAACESPAGHGLQE